MLKKKTKKRLAAAVEAVTSLQHHLERALRKIDEEPDDAGSVDVSELRLWLSDQIKLWKTRRDHEQKASESFRFFDGKCEGLVSVLRFLDEQAGIAENKSNRGYLSAKDELQDSAASLKLTNSVNMIDTVAD